MMFRFLTLLSLLSAAFSASISQFSKLPELQAIKYREYPRRSQDEAAIVEWGHSAIIHAFDVTVADFGPQTSQNALMEIETKPVAGLPIDGLDEMGNVVDKLTNDVFGNVVVMTRKPNAKVTGSQLALAAQKAGAAAVLIVYLDPSNPEETGKLLKDEFSDAVDIPTASMSYNSAHVLTNIETTGKPIDLVKGTMPEVVRLYASADRPYYESASDSKPTLFFIHNMMSAEECNGVVSQAKGKVEKKTEADLLQYLPEPSIFKNSPQSMIWNGGLMNKMLDERVEHTTAFPVVHLTDYVVHHVAEDTFWKPHYNTAAFATITLFLTEDGPTQVYPLTDGGPIEVKAKQGMAVISHNWDERHRLDRTSLQAMLPNKSGYVAQRFVVVQPQSLARRYVLPILSLPFGGKLPKWVSSFYDWLYDYTGRSPEDTEYYFDKVFVVTPGLIVLLLVQLVSSLFQSKPKRTRIVQRKKEQ